MDQHELIESPAGKLEEQTAIGHRALSFGRDLEWQEMTGIDGGKVMSLTFKAASSRPTYRRLAPGWVREHCDYRGLEEQRLADGDMPLLDTHNNDRTRSAVGVIRGYRVMEHNGVSVLEVRAEFPLDDPDSKRAYNKVRLGLIRNVSIGYRPLGPAGIEVKWRDEEPGFDAKRDVVADYYLRKWEIFEVSLVPVPEDDSVGIGRSIQPLPELYARMITSTRSTAMSDNTTKEETKPAVEAQETAPQAQPELEAPAARSVKPELPAVPAPAVPQAAPKLELDARGLQYLAANRDELIEKQGVEDAAYRSLVKEAGEGAGLSVEAVRSRLWEHLEQRDARAVQEVGTGQAPAFHKKDAEHNFFDSHRLCRQLITREGLAVDGREAELIQEYERSIDANKAPERNVAGPSVMIPFAALAEDAACRKTITSWLPVEMRRAYEVGGTPSGHFHEVFDEGFFVEALIAQARTLPHFTRLPSELVQDLVGVTESGEIQTYHSTESQARVESTGLSFGNRTFNWHQINAVKFTTQRTLDQSRFFLPTLLNRLRRDAVRGINNTAISSNGGSGAPTGITHYSGIQTIEIGTNGGAPTYEHLTKMIETIESANANVESGKFVMTPGIKHKLMNTPRLTGSTGAMTDRILTYQTGEGASVDGKMVITENNLPQNGTKGTGTNLHTMIFGDLSDIEWGTFSGLELTTDIYTGLANSQIKFYLRMAYDILPRHVASVCILTDADVS